MNQDCTDYVEYVESNKYFKKFAQFQAEHPEIPADWAEFVEPRIQKFEREAFAFVFSLF